MNMSNGCSRLGPATVRCVSVYVLHEQGETAEIHQRASDRAVFASQSRIAHFNTDRQLVYDLHIAVLL